MIKFVKYYMLLNGKPYQEVFKDHYTATDFFEDVESDGDEILFVDCEEVTANQILVDEDFTENYRMEVALEMVDPNHEACKTYEEVFNRLKELGYLK